MSVSKMNHELKILLDDYIKQKRYPLVNSVLLYKDDALLAEAYYNKFDENSRNNIKSIWKSILSVCAGICLDKGLIKSLDDPVAAYLPQFDRNEHPYHKLLKVKHLLTMTSGIYWNGGIHYHCPMLKQCLQSDDPVGYISDINMSELPGTRNLYKEWDVILLSALISKASGMNTFDFCNEVLYKPLNILSGRWWTSQSGCTYNIGIDDEQQAQSDLSAKDLAKIGRLFLNKGKHESVQIISEAYINKALTPSELNKNYGFLWWLGERHYGCSGFGGQEVTVIPDERLVFVIQAKAMARHRVYSDILDFLKENIDMN